MSLIYHRQNNKHIRVNIGKLYPKILFVNNKTVHLENSQSMKKIATVNKWINACIKLIGFLYTRNNLSQNIMVNNSKRNNNKDAG